MKLSELKQIIKEEIHNLLENDANIKKAVEYYNQNQGRISMKDAADKFSVSEFDVVMALQQGALSGIRLEAKKAKKQAKPDFLDMDKDGDKKEPMKKALKDKEKKAGK